MTRISTSAELTWRADLVFDATSAGTRAVLDSHGKAGPSPMQFLALSLTGCMSMDVVDILKKGRHEVRGVRARFTGQRAGEPPKRFEEITLHFVIDGHPPADAVDRAIELSRKKYCSVWHSMRQDIKLTVTYQIRDRKKTEQIRNKGLEGRDQK